MTIYDANTEAPPAGITLFDRNGKLWSPAPHAMQDDALAPRWVHYNIQPTQVFWSEMLDGGHAPFTTEDHGKAAAPAVVDTNIRLDAIGLAEKTYGELPGSPDGAQLKDIYRYQIIPAARLIEAYLTGTDDPS